MPCDSSHLEATSYERESAKIRELLREVNGEPFNHKRPAEHYGNVATIHQDTETLCAWCKSHDVAAQSLELQVWWRDHQIADAEKERERIALEARAALVKGAVQKLTPAERKALGFDPED